MRRAIIALALVISVPIAAQVVGATGRTSGSSGAGGAYSSVFSLSGITSPLTCTGASCSNTSATVSPGSKVSFGTITFNSSQDLSVSMGGLYGGGAGIVQVSCDGGSTYLTIAEGTGSIGSSVTYTYPPARCTGVTNLNTLKFRTTLGGGGSTSFNMSISPSSSVVIAW